MCFGGEGNWGVVSFASPHKDHEKSGLLQASLQYPFLLLLLARWAASARALRSLSLVGLSPHKAHKKRGLMQASLQRLLFLCALPSSMLEHVFNKYPVAFGAVLDEDVGDRAD